jgi:hypothetical protein
MILSKGWLFRLGIFLKDFGERHPWLSLGIVRPLGLKLKDWVLEHSTAGEMVKHEKQTAYNNTGKTGR